MRKVLGCLIVLLTCEHAFAADQKWIHATSANFDMYAAESDSDARAALMHLEAVRAYFLAATHSKDPGSQPVRIVAFRSESDFSRYRPAEVGPVHVYAFSGGAPASIVVLGLKPEIYEQIFREYCQMVLDASAPTLAYWFRAGLAEVYSTLKPGEGTLKLGSPPIRAFKSSGQGVDLVALVTIDRAGLAASRAKQDSAFYADTNNPSPRANAAFGAANAAQTTALNQVQANATQDYAGVAWMLTHMIMFSQDYRPRFGEFTGAMAGGMDSGTAFNNVYGRSLAQVGDDLRLYAKQSSLAVATVKFTGEKPASPQVKAATKEEQDRIFADLAGKSK
jgi:hypothetical protein